MGFATAYGTLRGECLSVYFNSRWIAATIISSLQFTPEKMSKAVEDDLCLLWDMTVEEDVMKFLLKHDFYTIAAQCFETSTPPRISVSFCYLCTCIFVE